MWTEPFFDTDESGSSPGAEKSRDNSNNNKRRRGRRRGGGGGSGGNKGGQGQQPANANQAARPPSADGKEAKGVTLRGTVKIEGAMPDLEPTAKPKPPRGEKSAPRKAPKNRRNRERPRIVEDEEPENAFKIILKTAQLPQDQKLTLDEYFAKYEIEVPDLPDEGEQHDAMD